MDLVLKYFKNLTSGQIDQLYNLPLMYFSLHEDQEIFPRKKINAFYKTEVLYAYCIARFMEFKPGTSVLDVGSGPGFPCIPLAILFPQVQFTMCDYAPTIKIAKEVSEFLELKNTTVFQGKAEDLAGKFHFVTGRAVAYPGDIYLWTKDLISSDNFNTKPNGYFLFKDDYLTKEIRMLQNINHQLVIEEIALSQLYPEDFFERQKMIYFYPNSRQIK